MMLARIPVAAVWAAAAMLVSGCAVGPDFEHPPPPEVTRYTPEPLAPRTTATAGVQDGQAQRFINGRDIPGEWWRLFGSRPLNSLVQKSLIANPNLQAAQAALRQAQELLAAQKGKFFPSADASFTPTRQQQSGSLGAVTSTPATLFNLYTAQVAVTYTLDVWGEIAERSNRCRRRRITSAS
jgi:outer membrane protein TolC